MVWKVTFEFTARDGQRYEAFGTGTDVSQLEDDTDEPLLYDPSDPSRACLLDEAPGRPEVEMNGDLRGRPKSAMLSLIVPGFVISAIALAVYFMKFR